MLRGCLSLLFSLAICIACASDSSAALLFSNLGQVSDNDAGMAFVAHRPASEFLTGASATTLTGVSARIHNFDDFSHGISAFLYSDSSNSPGSLLTTFTPVDNLLAAGQLKVVTFSHAGYSLAANTQYWLGISLTENAIAHSVAWIETTSNGEDAGSLFTVDSPPNRYYSIDTGSSFAEGPARNGQFQLEGTVVPEPGSCVLGLIGVAGLLLGRFLASRCQRCKRV